MQLVQIFGPSFKCILNITLLTHCEFQVGRHFSWLQKTETMWASDICFDKFGLDGKQEVIFQAEGIQGEFRRKRRGQMLGMRVVGGLDSGTGIDHISQSVEMNNNIGLLRI